MRLDKFLSNATDLSRTQAKRAIKQGQVCVNGHIETNTACTVSNDQLVQLHDTPISAPGPRYFMLNKPPGYVSATSDRLHPTAIDLLDEPNRDRLHIAGRLDIDSSGLLLITDDGNWSHRITSPNHSCDKHYLVGLTEELGEHDVKLFAGGLMLDGEKHRTKPAQLIILSERTARVIISEGRYHQVKRMFAAIGNHVTSLHRQQIGRIQLDDALRSGEYRPLLDHEFQSVHQ